MRLADFIATHQDAILAEWAAFARTLGPAPQETSVGRFLDHAEGMLDAIVADLRTPESEPQREEKGKGQAPEARSGAKTAARVHGTVRAKAGFSIVDMVSEYRALRASVIRLWTKDSGTLSGDYHVDLLRFDESIDQALSEATVQYSQDVDRAMDMFVAILGHDLRVPLDASLMASQFLLDNQTNEEPQLSLLNVIARSNKRMALMVSDLLDFTRGLSADGIPITRGDMDLGLVARDAVDELAVTEPGRVFLCTTTGDQRGSWDAARLGQVLSNLLGNAVQHGVPKSPISVMVDGKGADVELRVHGEGAPIPEDEIPLLFSPFKRLHEGRSEAGGGGHLGLGLFIAERITHAHGGTIDVSSTVEAGTTFTVRLPRAVNAVPAVAADRD
jgi:signal transduction histidine kinase